MHAAEWRLPILRCACAVAADGVVDGNLLCLPKGGAIEHAWLFLYVACGGRKYGGLSLVVLADHDALIAIFDLTLPSLVVFVRLRVNRR